MKLWIKHISALVVIGSLLGFLGNTTQAQSENSEIVTSYGIAMFDNLKYPEQFNHFNYVFPDAPKGGELILAAVGTFDSLNGFILRGNPALGINYLYDTLLVRATDEPHSAYGLVAESLTYPKDRSWVTFKLRPQARWHDGTPLTAEDVVFTFDILKSKGHPSYKAIYRDVLKAEALSLREVKFTFLNNMNRELPIIVGQLPILPKAYYQKHSFDQPTLERPLGSGPYRISKLDTGRSITYERVDNYWARDLPVNQGKYNFDRLRYDYYRDTVVAIEAIKAGKYDLRVENISKVWEHAYQVPALKEGKLIKVVIPHNIPQGMQAFVLNLRRNKFQDIRVRKALNYAFDYEWENKNIFYNAYTRLNSYFTNSEFSAERIPPSAEEIALLEPFKSQLPEELLKVPYMNPVTDGSGHGIRKNLLQAKSLLEEAGWVIKDGKRVFSTTNQPLTVEFLIDEPVFERVIAPYIKNLQRLGIIATIRTIDNAQYEKRMQEFDFDVIIATYPQSPSPGNEQINYWHSSKAQVPGSRNLAGIQNPLVDYLVEKIIEAADKQSLMTATRALDRVLLWQYYMIPNWFSQSFRVIYWDKFGRPKQNPPYELCLDCWWFDKEKAKKVQ